MTCYGSDGQPARSVRAEEDPYMALFMQGMTLRPSCYACPARAGRSGSDLTLADLWSVAASVPELNDDKGVSGVLVNSAKGDAAMRKVKAEIRREVAVAAVVSENGGFAQSVPVPEKREEFFKGLGVAGVDVYSHLNRYVVRRPLPVRIYRKVRSVLSSVKRRIMK